MYLIPEPLLDLHLSISNGFVSSKISDDFDFNTVNFLYFFLFYFIFFGGGGSFRSTSYGVDISQVIRFARISSYVTDFNARNEILTDKLHHKGYRIINFKREDHDGAVSLP